MSRASSPASVLVVDDEPQVLAALEDTLENDFRILTATSPARGLEILKAERNLSVILSDQRMPGMMGHDFLARAQEASNATRLLITGYSDIDAVIAAVNEGKIFGYVSKPWDRAALKIVVYKAVEHHTLVQELHEREERFRQLAENIRDVFWMISADTGEGIYLSPAYEEIWARTRQSLREHPESWLDAVHPEDRQSILDSRGIVMRNSAASTLEFRVIRPDGSARNVRERMFPVCDSDGQLYRIAGVAEDITERKTQDEKITRLTRIYAVLSGINSAIVRIHDRQALFDEACRIAVEHGGFDLALVLKVEPVSMQVTPMSWGGAMADIEFVKESMLGPNNNVATQTGTVAQSVRQCRPVYCNDLGKEPEIGLARSEMLRRGYRSVISLPLMPGGECFGVMVLYTKEPDVFDDLELRLLTELAGDISFGLEFISKEEQAAFLAYHDPLTGLGNRAMLHERMGLFVDEAAREGGHLALILLDVDRFKTINSTLGRTVGDTLLCQLAERLARSIGEPARIARLGSDQFTVILPGVRDANHAARLVDEQVMGCFNDPFRPNGQELRIAGKVGIALYPEDGADADTLFRNAEAAVKKAKNSGDRYLFYTQEMTEKVAENLTLENELRRALEREEFVLYYQPKIELATGKISGLEALIRWQHPERGLVPPMEFIPLLEEIGLILEVGEWALERAAIDFRAWRTRGLTPPGIAVNVSAIQLRQKQFVERAERAIGRRSDPIVLDLEITESTIMENLEEGMSKLLQLKSAGFGIVVDDFGTGYSSLSYIASMPINALKIDRSFVVSMTSSPQSRLIVSAIVTLAHALSLKVVAEGVDSEEQLEILRDLKCDEVQGFLFSKAIPPAEVVVLLTERRNLLPNHSNNIQ